MRLTLNMNKKNTHIALFSGIALTVLLLSQGIGYWVNSTLAVGTSFEFTNLIHFTHVRNFGGVFGMFQGSGFVFGFFSFGLLSMVVAYLWFSNSLKRYEYICFGFIVGGGASNILDRLLYGSVIDFIDIQHIPYWNYVFNTADMMVHIGIWPMLIFGFVFDSQLKKDSAPK